MVDNSIKVCSGLLPRLLVLYGGWSCWVEKSPYLAMQTYDNNFAKECNMICYLVLFFLVFYYLLFWRCITWLPSSSVRQRPLSRLWNWEAVRIQVWEGSCFGKLWSGVKIVFSHICHGGSLLRKLTWSVRLALDGVCEDLERCSEGYTSSPNHLLHRYLENGNC